MTSAEHKAVYRQEDIIDEIVAERKRQDEKWGVQYLPGIELGLAGQTGASICRYYGMRSERAAKAACETAIRVGRCTHAHIVIEELAEALSATTPEEMRAELVQTAATVLKWLEDIDRNAGARGGA